jgi:TPR repeat protein
MGLMYKHGDAVRQSWPRALACFEKAARLGDPDAATELADYYGGEEGDGPDPRRAVRLLREAARLDHPGAMCLLGWHYEPRLPGSTVEAPTTATHGR